MVPYEINQIFYTEKQLWTIFGVLGSAAYRMATRAVDIELSNNF